MAFAQAVGLRKFPLFVPATQAVDFIAADFDVEIAHGDEAGQRGDFVLRVQDDASGSNRIDEAKFFYFRKSLGEREFSFAVDARVRDGFVEGDFRRPLRNGVVAFAAFVKANLDGDDFVEKIGGALDEKIGEAGRGAGVDDGGAVFFLETFGVAELFGKKRVSREMRAEVEIMRAKTKRGAKNDFVEYGRAGIDDELAAFCGLDDAAQVAGIHFFDGNGAFFAEEATGAGQVAVAAPDGVALALQKLCEEGAGRSRSQNEDPHGVKETLS